MTYSRKTYRYSAVLLLVFLIGGAAILIANPRLIRDIQDLFTSGRIYLLSVSDPIEDAQEAIDSGKAGFVAIKSFNGYHYPGITCSTNVPSSAIERSEFSGHAFYGNKQEEFVVALVLYGVKYNQTIITSPNYANQFDCQIDNTIMKRLKRLEDRPMTSPPN